MLMLGWTTVETREDAVRMADTLVEERLAACVQIEGPLQSVYRWEGKVVRTEEFRLLVKFPPELCARLEARVLALHPYSTPEWIVFGAEQVAEKYLSWARSNCTSAPF
jgi:periplasmic divalent cation tolerance protein